MNLRHAYEELKAAIGTKVQEITHGKTTEMELRVCADVLNARYMNQRGWYFVCHGQWRAQDFQFTLSHTETCLFSFASSWICHSMCTCLFAF